MEKLLATLLTSMLFLESLVILLIIMLLLPAVAVYSAVANVIAAVGSPKVPFLVMASAVADIPPAVVLTAVDINGVPPLARVSAVATFPSAPGVFQHCDAVNIHAIFRVPGDVADNNVTVACCCCLLSCGQRYCCRWQS